MVEGVRAVNEVRNTRVGFVLPPGDWAGGKNYLRNLFVATRDLSGSPITPVLFLGKHQSEASGFPDVETVATSLLDRKSPLWFLRKVIAKTTSQDVLLGRLMQRHNISVLSHSPHLGKQTAIKTIGWIPDFQHVYLPQFFTPQERSLRDRDFMSVCVQCDKVIVSSQAAQADLKSFAPDYVYKVELLRFVASPVPLSNAASLPELQKIYNFDAPHFILPNQFWAHKNHRVVISALRELKRQGLRLLVLATGSTKDYRNPSFFPSLMQYAAECDVLDSFRVLGQIPFEHLAGLMRHAVAFINPSQFEGWSTSVEEAKSMGKQIVLSDIPVHREQAPERGFYFPAEDPKTLAGAMVAAYTGFDESHDAAMQDAATVRFPERLLEFGKAYLSVVENLTSSCP